ncbi:MAG TPA: DUF1592 domain-containing protein [Verrucomicrobiae bacterium]|nr:DUF1592 domain-containing protein [Verrucomicrobiae bacterium]
MNFVRLLIWPVVVGFAIVAHAGAPLARRSLEPDKRSGHAPVSSDTFQTQIVPLLSKYCYGCHGNGKRKGDFALDAYQNLESVKADPKAWEKILQNLRQETMPPARKPKPSSAEHERITRWIEEAVFHCDCDNPDPGRITLRRLNRAEYNNTIRDLVGVTFRPADDFPADDSGYGFDNIGDVLSVPPVLLEKYLTAAESILDAAIVTTDPAKVRRKQFPAESLPGTAPGESADGGARLLSREGDIHVDFNFPKAGEYALRARAYGQQAGAELPRMRFRLNTNALETFDVAATSGESKVYQHTLRVAAGTNRFSAAYINNFVDRKKGLDRNLYIEHLEIEGPLDVPLDPPPASHARIFFKGPNATNDNAYAKAIIERFAARAFRRPPAGDEVERLVTFSAKARKQGESFERSIQLALQAVLVSPHFLFRGELSPEPDNPNVAYALDEYALASRLSYFLWSSTPDERLFELAAKGRLRRNLETQILRMLKDPKSRALVDNFAGQWLQLRNMRIVTPDAATYPKFDERLRDAMVKETEMFFEGIIQDDRSVLEFLDADYTYVNERLARHYGMPGVRGESFQRVSLRGTGRAGLLTQGSLLTLTSNPTRTSPVKRGKYILENILGSPPPPPPPDVPELKEVKLAGTLRQRMVQHRENPMCASCHDRMDPIGFGFENFDGVGAWRERDDGYAIDPAGQLASGEAFKGSLDLTRILAKTKRDDFTRCLSEKMLTYALGRGLEYYDKCAVAGITKRLRRGGYRFSALVRAVVDSVPFQERRGEARRTVALNEAEPRQ